jgi:uncharacterized protein YggU (UPF0235/DUF167 family)
MPESRITVRLRPRGSREELGGIRDGVLEAKVTAPPVDGATIDRMPDEPHIAFLARAGLRG